MAGGATSNSGASVSGAFGPAGFFLLRSPVFPIERLISLSEPNGRWHGADSKAPGLYEAGNNELQAWVRDPWVQAATYVASPSLSERLDEWLGNPVPQSFESIRPALFRYFLRMSGRATPFGLFASFSIGRFDSAAHFAQGPRASLCRHTWPDFGVLYPFIDRLTAVPEIRRELRYLPNSSLYRHDDGWRYVEQQVQQSQRRRNLARVESTEILDQVIERCQGGLSFAELTGLILQLAPESAGTDALDYVSELIDSQILVPDFAPSLTGPNPVERLIDLSAGRPPLAEANATLRSVAETLAGVDRSDVDSLCGAYKATALSLMDLLGDSAERQLFHVDLRREAPGLALPESILAEILDVAHVLRRICPRARPNHQLEGFRRRFVDRYGDGEVDLMVALDEDTGIGFEMDPASRRNEGLLADFKLETQENAESNFKDGPRRRQLLELLERAWSDRRARISLTEDDISRLSIDGALPLPDVFTAFGSVVSVDADGEGPDQIRLVLELILPGVGLFGRFCRSDPELTLQIKALLLKEEALNPEAVFAELVHLPADRTGNIVCRPTLRSKDLPYLGQSGLDPADQIRVSDLTVRVDGGRIVLRSRSLGREVLPRLTSAHNAVSSLNTSIYRFLAALATQDCAGTLGFSWGAEFAEMRFLPRVTYRCIVLSPASWRIDPAIVSSWSKFVPGERRQRVCEVRRQLEIPRWIQVSHDDSLLTLDLDHPWCIDALVDELTKAPSSRIAELIPPPDKFCLESLEGHHANEVMIPFVRSPSEPMKKRQAPVISDPGACRRRYPPGSDWLYAKIYGSFLSTEKVLLAGLFDTIRQAQADGTIERWHFIRYRDPDDHLRIRLQGDPGVLRERIAPELERLFQRWTAGSSIWRCQFDTYEREVTRYGGPEAIEIAEAVFDADSELVLALLRTAPDGAAGDWRWQISTRVADLYHAAFALDLPARQRLAKRTDLAFRTEFKVSKDFEGQVSRRYRKDRALLEALLAGGPDGFPATLRWAEPEVMAFKTRLVPLAARLNALSAAGRLTGSLEEIVGSLVHMHVNRMMLANPREHEMIIHAFLERLCRWRIATARPGSDPGCS